MPPRSVAVTTTRSPRAEVGVGEGVRREPLADALARSGVAALPIEGDRGRAVVRQPGTGRCTERRPHQRAPGDRRQRAGNGGVVDRSGQCRGGAGRPLWVGCGHHRAHRIVGVGELGEIGRGGLTRQVDAAVGAVDAALPQIRDRGVAGPGAGVRRQPHAHASDARHRRRRKVRRGTGGRRGLQLDRQRDVLILDADRCWVEELVPGGCAGVEQHVRSRRVHGSRRRTVGRTVVLVAQLDSALRLVGKPQQPTRAADRGSRRGGGDPERRERRVGGRHDEYLPGPEAQHAVGGFAMPDGTDRLVQLYLTGCDAVEHDHAVDRAIIDVAAVDDGARAGRPPAPAEHDRAGGVVLLDPDRGVGRGVGLDRPEGGADQYERRHHGEGSVATWRWVDEVSK